MFCAGEMNDRTNACGRLLPSAGSGLAVSGNVPQPVDGFTSEERVQRLTAAISIRTVSSVLMSAEGGAMPVCRTPTSRAVLS